MQREDRGTEAAGLRLADATKGDRGADTPQGAVNISLAPTIHLHTTLREEADVGELVQAISDLLEQEFLSSVEGVFA